MRKRFEELEYQRMFQNGEIEFGIHNLVLDVWNNISDIFYSVKKCLHLCLRFLFSVFNHMRSKQAIKPILKSSVSVPVLFIQI